MSDTIPAGDLVARFFEEACVGAAFGVISIHNMPMLDAIGRRNRIRFVAARTEAGAVNMADAYARAAGGVGLAFSSTGTAAGNTCGALVEAQTAQSPVVHVTGQIERNWLDRDSGYIHEARDQLAMLRAVCKGAWRVQAPEMLLPTLKEAVRVALTPPMGPVSVEIPIDVQEGDAPLPPDFAPLPVAAPAPADAAVDALADALSRARRPMLWLGGGALGAGAAARRLADLGFGIVTSVHGRGIVAEDHPRTLGSFNVVPAAEALYAGCDAMVVAGSRLRSNETLKYMLRLPQPLYRIDADPAQENKPYPAARFVCADAALTLDRLADCLAGRMRTDAAFGADIAAARQAAEAALRRQLGPYEKLVDALAETFPADAAWVRDITVSNTAWGNRLPVLRAPGRGIHALGGGIGQGLPMAIGAALGAPGRPVVALAGDGGLAVSLGELATLAQEGLDVVLIVMNDGGYGVIKNIQDDRFGGRHYFADLKTPDLAGLARGLGIDHCKVAAADDFLPVLRGALAARGPRIVEVDMTAVGPFAQRFAGPPVRNG
ncbi:MAG: thiamine pyrophosphate-binding protein [Rhodospirillaceae bacterium]